MGEMSLPSQISYSNMLNYSSNFWCEKNFILLNLFLLQLFTTSQSLKLNCISFSSFETLYTTRFEMLGSTSSLSASLLLLRGMARSKR